MARSYVFIASTYGNVNCILYLLMERRKRSPDWEYSILSYSDLYQFLSKPAYKLAIFLHFTFLILLFVFPNCDICGVGVCCVLVFFFPSLSPQQIPLSPDNLCFIWLQTELGIALLLLICPGLLPERSFLEPDVPLIQWVRIHKITFWRC